VKAALVPLGTSTCTYTLAGGMLSGKNSTPWLNRPNRTIVPTKTAAAIPTTIARWSSAQRSRRS
jgi:hypothetical protein